MKGTRQKKIAAFTLIEVLVTLVIFSLILSLATMAFGYFDTQFQQIKKQEMRSSSELTSLMILGDAFESTVDYFVQNEDYRGYYKMFFEGTETSCTFVSLRSFFRGKGSSLCRFSYDEKRHELIYEEASLGGVVFTSRSEVDLLLQSGKKYKWLLDKEESFAMSYKIIEKSANFLAQGKVNWVANCSAAQMNILPKAVRFILKNDKISQEFIFQLVEGNPGKSIAYMMRQPQ
ncbi:MAG: prepilin-type N-terminal cleavage/methylation domain-containing protein [Lentisphaeraceae bacterium]|nr:prepilin-type N-terminal cleavage/methylation domain-containing protein [Lentisphaeraceae bacterium]